MIIVIKNATVITMDKNRNEYENIDVVIKDDKIFKLEKNYNGSFDKLIDAKNKVVMPGLINAHTHLGMSIFRATNDNLSLQEWLSKKIWPIEDNMNDDDIYYSSLLSCIEMIKTGTTCANDMYFGWKGTMKAVLESKIRISMSRCLLGKPNDDNNRMKDFIELLNTYKNNNKVSFTVSPHAFYTCSKEYLLECLELSNRYDLPIHMHFCENKGEVDGIINDYNMSPVNALKSLGYLDKKLILAHGTYISESDQKLIPSNVSIVTNPISNLNLGCGIADITSYLKNNINVCLGTDGQGSGNNINLFHHMSILADLQKAKYLDPTIISSYDVLKIATINGAKALGLDDKIGSIEIGKQADLIILDIDNIELYPHENLICNIVHNVESNNIDTTIIDGEILMQDHELLLPINENKLKEKIHDILNKLNIK